MTKRTNEKKNSIKAFRNISLLMLVVIITALLSVRPLYIRADAADQTSKESSAQAEKEGDALPQYDTEDVTFHISLDAGHGGEDSGVEGFGTSEKVLTLKLARFLKEELLKYNNVTVELTRTKDTFISLKERTAKAMKQNADLMVCLHFDGYDPYCAYSSGCSAIVAKKGTYRPHMVKEEKKVARSILRKLDELGLKNHGLIRRLSAEGETYPDGSLADYYGVIRRGMLNKLPTILVEHGFLDSSHDYNNFFDSDEKLRDLARTDAEGIAAYLRLENKKTGEIPKPVMDNGKKQVCRRKEGSYISVRAKSYNLDQVRNKKAVIKEDKAKKDQGQGKEKENAQEESTRQEIDTKENKGQKAENLLSSGKAERDAVRLTGFLLGLLFLWCLYASVKEKKESRG